MKTIGILGGASWPSTITAYEMLNKEVARHAGGHHSAKIILYSMNYNDIKSQYPDGWDKIPQLFKRELEVALSLRPDCLFVANNTLHKAFDLIEGQISLSIPFFHAVRITCDHLMQRRVKKALFLGTAFTMTDDYFMGPLRQAGIELIVPDRNQRASIQQAQSMLARKEKPDWIVHDFFHSLFEQYQNQDCDNVVLACTELPLLVDRKMTSMNIIDPLTLQCRAAVKYALG